VKTYAQKLGLLDTCGGDCLAVFDEGILACREAACDPGCSAESHAGGIWIPPTDRNRARCDCYDDPTATPVPTNTPAPTATATATPAPALTPISAQDAGDDASESSSGQPVATPSSDTQTDAEPSPSEVGTDDSSKDQASTADTGRADSSSEPARDSREGAQDDEIPRCLSFRIRPVSSWSVGEIVGYTRVTYELQEIYDDGTTGRRCTLRFSGWGLTVGLPVNANFAPGYQWTEFDAAKGRMRLEDFDRVKGYHTSGGALLYGAGGFFFGTRDDTWSKQAQSRGASCNVGIYAGVDWMFGAWTIIEPPR